MSFRDDFRDKRRVHGGTGPGSWDRIQTALGGLAFLWALDLFFVAVLGRWAMVLGVLLVPVGAVLFVRGWVRSAGLMAVGLATAMIGVLGSFALDHIVP